MASVEDQPGAAPLCFHNLMRHHPAIILAIIIFAPLLCSCGGDYLTDSEVAQTAVAQGCWSEDTRPTPYPVTVTAPGGASAPTATVIANFGDPTFTPAPTATRPATTTPLPRCTPQPGQTQVAWPTPLPTEPPYPTRPVSAAQPQLGSDDVLRVADPVLMLDVAVHPQSSWAAVAAVSIPISNKGDTRVYVRAYRPAEHRWGPATTVDREGTHPIKFRSVSTAITPDGTIHVIWGVTEYPDMTLFATHSTDLGATWSAPEPIGRPFFSVLDVAATDTNEIYVLALWADAAHDGVIPALLHRSAAGEWDSELLPENDTWYASSGALAVVGTGDTAQLVTMVTAFRNLPGSALTLSRPLRGGSWVAQFHTIPDAGSILTDAQVVAYPYRDGATLRQAVTFSATMRDEGSMFALTSLDGGATWLPWSTITSPAGIITAGGIAFDPSAQRLVAVWNCCEEALWGSAASTHYAAWANPVIGGWTPPAETTLSARAPLITGARSAHLTQLAHAINARVAWLVWVENARTVRARAVNLDRIIPASQYPTPTPRPTSEAQP
ncbi:exo-alpha-sialidase [Oscillochloris sp. ZM17-4]|uniref:glycoside hydrolase n=1 Tax=Oscillochloris sp. ZM17-4 TaxID=2866714 RepID=UPI001C738F57|nr:glycoside hydrolase [Oscillochloris sp. ZM17-4]MBX0331125.1 exo-alpha-sialidase [Oscillochloris sp. ZM17-4]